MNSQDLIAIGWQLARPCIHLHTAAPSESIIAVWGGVGIVPPPFGPYTHWISVACHVLPHSASPQTGWLSVYVDTDDYISGVVAIDPATALPENLNSGIALAGTSTRSFPPIDAITQVPEVDAWLESHGIVHDPRQATYFENDDYNLVYQQQCPLYTDDTIAVIGGWHVVWPDGDWHELQHATLLVWTLRDAEPWVETWQMPDGSFQVLQRIS